MFSWGFRIVLFPLSICKPESGQMGLLTKKEGERREKNPEILESLFVSPQIQQIEETLALCVRKA